MSRWSIRRPRGRGPNTAAALLVCVALVAGCSGGGSGGGKGGGAAAGGAGAGPATSPVQPAACPKPGAPTSQAPTGLTQRPPSLQGVWTWAEDEDHRRVVLVQQGTRLTGIAEYADGRVSFYVNAQVADDGTVTGSLLYTRLSSGDTPEDVYSQVLASPIGDPAHPGLVKGDVSWKLDAAAGTLTGERTIFTIDYSSSDHHLNGVTPEKGAMKLTKGVQLPDLAVAALRLTRTEEQNGTVAVFRIAADVCNIGAVDVDKEVKVQLFSAGDTVGPDPAFRALGDPIVLQPLKAGATTTLRWIAHKQEAGAQPIDLEADTRYLRVLVDPEQALDEVTKTNNARRIEKLDCDDKHSAFFDVPDPASSAGAPGDLALPGGGSDLTSLDGAFTDKAEVVLCRIKLEAQRRARAGPGTIAGSNFERALATDFLRDYLASPSNDTAAKAIAAIGAYRGSGFVSHEYVVVGAARLYIPQGLRDQYPGQLPEYILPATQFSPGGDNHSKIPLIDGPFLVGDENRGQGIDDDIVGGRNWTNVMHWGTGVGYSDLPDQALREMFIGYELWHLEGWDVFGEDSINDLIGEDAGQQLGRRIRQLSIKTEGDLVAALDQDFRASRAWVGALLAVHNTAGDPPRPRLDDLVLAQDVPKAQIWWGKRGETVIQPWKAPSIRQMLDDGKTVDQVVASAQAQHLIQVYTLIYEAQEWSRNHGSDQLSPTMRDVVSGKYDDAFKAGVDPNNFSARWEWNPK